MALKLLCRAVPCRANKHRRPAGLCRPGLTREAGGRGRFVAVLLLVLLHRTATAACCPALPPLLPSCRAAATTVTTREREAAPREGLREVDDRTRWTRKGLRQEEAAALGNGRSMETAALTVVARLARLRSRTREREGREKEAAVDGMGIWEVGFEIFLFIYFFIYI